ncbi:hypothetical protein ACLOJK_037348, partial [Asimina triloba]
MESGPRNGRDGSWKDAAGVGERTLLAMVGSHGAAWMEEMETLCVDGGKPARSSVKEWRCSPVGGEADGVVAAGMRRIWLGQKGRCRRRARDEGGVLSLLARAARLLPARMDGGDRRPGGDGFGSHGCRTEMGKMGYWEIEGSGLAHHPRHFGWLGSGIYKCRRSSPPAAMVVGLGGEDDGAPKLVLRRCTANR